MICYKDKAFCASEVTEHTCRREITKEELEHAHKIGIPIAYGDFCRATQPQNENEKAKSYAEGANSVLKLYMDDTADQIRKLVSDSK